MRHTLEGARFDCLRYCRFPILQSVGHTLCIKFVFARSTYDLHCFGNQPQFIGFTVHGTPEVRSVCFGALHAPKDPQTLQAFSGLCDMKAY